MIEEIVLNYLNEMLSVPVCMEETAESGSEFVIIQKTDTSTTNCITTAMFTAKSYGKTMLRAAELNESVKLAMKSIAELPAISSCYLVTDYNMTDTASKRYRYQAVFHITHY